MAHLAQSSEVLPQSSPKQGQVCHGNIHLHWYQFVLSEAEFCIAVQKHQSKEHVGEEINK